jgi:hypothetical protein
MPDFYPRHNVTKFKNENETAFNSEAHDPTNFCRIFPGFADGRTTDDDDDDDALLLLLLLGSLETTSAYHRGYTRPHWFYKPWVGSWFLRNQDDREYLSCDPPY